MFEDAVEIRDRLAVLVDRLDPDAVSGQSARQLWGVLDASERLCAAGKTLLARRVAATHQPGKQGTKTLAEDLARKAGTSTGAAQDALATSNRLPDQPKVEEALRDGQLSAAQVALISAAVAVNPAEEARLVELASRVSVAELREECARVRAAADPDPEATNRRLHAARQLRRWIDSEGFWTLHAKGTPQAGAAFNTAIQPIIDQLFNNARRAERREPVQAYAFDALIHLVEHATGRCDCPLPADHAEPPDADNGDNADSASRGDDPASPETPARARANGEAETAIAGIVGTATKPQRASCGVRPRPTVNPRYLALLRVDVEALRRGGVAGGELCEIAGVGPVPVSVARGLLGEAILKLVITHGVDVLNVTHLGRGPTAAQRAALLWTNPTCSVQGCNRSRVENDHREPWADTQHTRLDELDPLCEFHHDLKTRLGYALVPGTGKRAFVPADDPRHPRYRKPRTGRPRPTGRPPGSEQPPDRPLDRPPERTDTAAAKTATTGRPLRARRRAPTAGQQPDLFAKPQPP